MGVSEGLILQAPIVERADLNLPPFELVRDQPADTLDENTTSDPLLITQSKTHVGIDSDVNLNQNVVNEMALTIYNPKQNSVLDSRTKLQTTNTSDNQCNFNACLCSFIKFSNQYFFLDIIQLDNNRSGQSFFNVVYFSIDERQKARLKIELPHQ